MMKLLKRVRRERRMKLMIPDTFLYTLCVVDVCILPRRENTNVQVLMIL